MNILKSSTFWGAVLAASVHYAARPSWATAGEAIGIIVATVGARKAIAKNGAGV